MEHTNRFYCVEPSYDITATYGDQVKVSRVDQFDLIHLDGPTTEEIHRRTDEFNADDFFFDSCPLCVAAKAEGGHIVFDGERDPISSTLY